MKKLLVCLFIILSSISFLLAQNDTRGFKIKLHSQAGKRWAICIGINNYTDNKLNSLKNAVNDANGLSAVLKEQGDFKVFTFTDCDDKGNPKAVNDKFLPTKRGIEDFLSNIVSFKDVQSNDLVVFSFSGHGISDAKGNNYLLPFDWNDVNPYESAISISHITGFFESLGVTKSLLLIDACREEMSASRSIDNMKRLYEEKFQSSVVSAVFYATKQGGFSYEDSQSKYGAFTRFLIEGLKGKGDQDKDGLVTFRDLSTYVENDLSSWAIENGYKQRPYTQLLVEQSGDLALTIADATMLPTNERKQIETSRENVAVTPIKESQPNISQDKDQQIVYITRTGKKYHRDGCRSLAKSKIPISLKEAVLSYGPCSVCNPPIIQQSIISKPPTEEKKSVTVYVTRTGSKYHRAGCRYLRRSSIPMSLEDAKQRYSPCSVCNPPP